MFLNSPSMPYKSCEPSLDEQIVGLQEQKNALEKVGKAIDEFISEDTFSSLDNSWIHVYGDAKLTTKVLAKKLDALYTEQERYARGQEIDC